MSEGLDLSLDDGQQAIADTVAQFCRDHCTEAAVKASAGRFPRSLWRGLAELGVFALATPEGDGGALEIVAAMESLGAAVYPGPLDATFLVCQLLDEAARADLVAGTAIVSVGSPPLLPWAQSASVFVEIDGARAWLASPRGAPEPVATLGGELWGRVELERTADLGDATRALALAHAARAAYLAGASTSLVEAAAAHARARRQFGRAIGDFQAVAHPLADCAMDLAASQTLARAAAYRWDAMDDAAPAWAEAAAASAARAALESASVCHQTFGALGVTLEGPVFHVSRRIQQLVATPPVPVRTALLAHVDL